MLMIHGDEFNNKINNINTAEEYMGTPKEFDHP